MNGQQTAGLNELAALAAQDAPYEITGEMDNHGRTVSAARALCTFTLETGLARSEENADTAVVDLLTNLMHLCDALNLNYDGIAAMAAIHYAEESDAAD